MSRTGNLTRWTTRHCRAGGNIARHGSTCADAAAAPYDDIFDDAYTRTDVNVVADKGRLTVIGSEGGKLTQCDIVADDSRRIRDYAARMTYIQSVAHAGAGRDKQSVFALEPVGAPPCYRTEPTLVLSQPEP